MARIGPVGQGEATIETTQDGASARENVIDPRTIVFTETPATSVEPGTSEPGTSEPGAKRRGRPPGSVNKAKARSPVSVSTDMMQFSLQGLHSMLAIMLSAPQWELSEEEAKHVSKSYEAVAQFYDMQASQKSIAWGNLAMTLMIVYGSRIGSTIALNKAKRQEAKANNPKATPTVVVQHPKQAGPPLGATPMVRKSTPDDLNMLNEAPMPMFG